MFSSLVDEAGKMVSEDGTEVTVEGAVEDQEVEKDEDGQEVIKVYIFKADSGEDDMGERKTDERPINTSENIDVGLHYLHKQCNKLN